MFRKLLFYFLAVMGIGCFASAIMLNHLLFASSFRWEVTSRAVYIFASGLLWAVTYGLAITLVLIWLIKKLALLLKVSSAIGWSALGAIISSSYLWGLYYLLIIVDGGNFYEDFLQGRETLEYIAGWIFILFLTPAADFLALSGQRILATVVLGGLTGALIRKLGSRFLIKETFKR